MFYHLQEIVFCVLVILAYLGTGIACAVYAAAWGGPPDSCDANEDDDYCDSKPLTATTALSTVS